MRRFGACFIGIVLVWGGTVDQVQSSGAVGYRPMLAQYEAPATTRRTIPPPSAHVALSRGTYSNELFELEFGLDRFALRDIEGEWAASGDYALVDGIITLSNPEPATDSVRFPIRCRVERYGPGIRLLDETGQCVDFDDVLLRRER